MGRVSSVISSAVLSVVLLEVSAVRAQPAPSAGSDGALTLGGDELGTYEIIPRKSEMTYTLDGPGVLFLYLLNHRVARRKAQTRVQMTLDGAEERVLTLNCPESAGRFVDQKKLLPCTRTTVDVVIPEGQHVVGLKILKTKYAASVHAIFTPSAPPEIELDADEPPLVATPGGDDATEVTAEPALEAPEPPPADPLPAEEPALVAAPAAETLELVPVDVEPEVDVVAVEEQGFAEALLEPVPLILLGTGAALAGASFYFGLEMNRDFSAYNDQENPRPQVDLPALEQSGKDNQVLMLAVGGAAVASLGAALIVAATSGAGESGTEPVAAGLSAGCVAGACGASFRWSWQ